METKNEVMAGIGVVALLAALIMLMAGWYTVDVGERGVKVTMGKMDDGLLRPGFGFKAPFITEVRTMNVRAQASQLKTICFSSDLQQITMQLTLIWSAPEQAVLPLMANWGGDIAEGLLAPRVQESLKEVVAQKSAQEIVKTREQIKIAALESARKKIGDILVLQDLVINNIDLSDELEKAIEQKMVQEQDAEKASYRKQQAQVDAETAIIAAKGAAESIRIQGDALEKNPLLVQLKMVEKWDGKAPQVVGGGAPNIMLPMGK